MTHAKTIETLPVAMPAAPGAVVQALKQTGRTFMSHVVPPLVIIGILLLIWQMLGSRPGAALPPPTKVVQDTWELILHPWYDNGGNDVGIGWQLLASLKRVAWGYSLAVVAGVVVARGGRPEPRDRTRDSSRSPLRSASPCAQWDPTWAGPRPSSR